MYKSDLNEKLHNNLGVMPAVIVDIDGTLAKMTDRGPFEQDKVLTDRPNTPVVELVQHLYENYNIIIFTGREGTKQCERDTLKWLDNHLIPWHFFYMRSPKDYRKDSIIKYELYKTFVQDKFDVRFIIDDRQQVVDMWRSIGLTVLQCDYGNF